MTGLSPTLLLLILLLPPFGAVLAPLVSRRFPGVFPYILALAPALSFAALASLIGRVAGGSVFLGGWNWVPSLNVRFSFRIDGLSLTFALLVTFIGALIVLYAGAYMRGARNEGRFHAFLLAFMGAMLGLVLADDLVTLFVFWELTSITSFLLIGFDHERPAARRAAVQALVVTAGGGLLLLAGLLAIREGLGLHSMSLVLTAGGALRDSALYVPILLLVLAGAFTKSAQVPFHPWLRNAMEAPTPVSAYLHSATMVKAGVYLLMRFHPALGGTALWETLLPLFGAATLLTGSLLAIRASDLKTILAYTTVASLGLLVMLVGVGTPAAITAAVLYLVAHSLFKGALFMVAGAVDHAAHTRDLSRLGGLREAMPVTFAAALLAALSMGGVLPFAGFLAKEEIYHALSADNFPIFLLLIAAVIGNALMFAAAFLVALKPFLGRRPAGLAGAHEGPALLFAGPLVLAAFGLLAGLFSGFFHATLSEPMVAAVLGYRVPVTIGPLPHPSLAFLLSLVTIVLGMMAYKRADTLRGAIDRFVARVGWGPDRGFDQAVEGLLRGAVLVTRRLQTGRLDHYMTVTFSVILVALFAPMIATGTAPDWPGIVDLRLAEALALAIVLVGIVAVVRARNRLTAIVSLGIQGFAVALLYLLLGAPDLSFTQFMVETLSVVILALVMARLKLYPADHRPLREKLPDAALAAGIGAGLGLALLSVLAVPFDRALPDFFEAYATSIAHGRNIVNVIIVDFRGVDTMGEIAVVMTTGLAILALLRMGVSRASGKNEEAP